MPPVSILTVVMKLLFAGFGVLLFVAGLIAIDDLLLHWFDDT